MKRVTKKDRQLYELLEQVSGLLSNPGSYGMREYYSMHGTAVRKQLMEKIETVLIPYRELLDAEYEMEINLYKD